MQIQMVTWIPPIQGWIKCNTDGTTKGNLGKSSYGYCIRDCLGDLIYVESNYIGISINMITESKAVKEALTYCISQSWDYVLVETNSLALMNILNKKWQIPWEIIDLLEKVLRVKQSIHIQIKYAYKETNQLVDHVANIVVHSE